MHEWGGGDASRSVRDNKNGEEETALSREQNSVETRYYEKKAPFVAAGTFLSSRCLQTVSQTIL
jgi:hypothetical protein